MRTILKFVMCAAVCIAVSAAFTGCTKKENAVKLKLTLAQTEIFAGEKTQFTISTETAPDSDILIAIQSDNTSVATVTPNVTLKAGGKSVSGEITAMAEGTANITVSADNAEITEPSATLTVKASPAVVDLSLAINKTEIFAGEKAEITVSSPVAPETDLTIKVTSSDPLVASVPATLTLKAGEKSVKGELIGASVGSAEITIEAEGTKISSHLKNITVKEPLKIELTLSVTSQTLFIGKISDFTISTPVAPTTDINFTLISSNADILAPVESNIVLKAGEKSVTGKVEGKAQGTATLSFVSNPVVTAIRDIIELTCETMIPEIYEITGTTVVGPNNPWDNFKHGYGPYNIGGIWYSDELVYDGKFGADIYVTVLDTYGGDFVGGYHKNMGVLKSIEYDTPIDENLNWIKWINGSYPSFWTEDGYSIGTGKMYVVCTLPSIDKYDPDNVYCRAWLEISSNGKYIQVLDGAICVNDAVFRVGMKAIE